MLPLKRNAVVRQRHQGRTGRVLAGNAHGVAIYAFSEC